MSRTWLMLGLVVAACGSDSATAPSPAPDPASAPLPVKISTSGVDPGTSSFGVLLDNVAERQVAVNGTTTLAVTPGRHLVRLHHLPSHCQIQVPGIALTEYAWERTLEVFTPAPAVFTVECFLVGNLRIELHTSGSHVPSLFIGVLSNHPAGILELPVNGGLTILNVRSGEHRLSLATGPNCLVSDPKLGSGLTVDIVPSQTTTLSLSLTCT